jgi:hypothetical protein
MSWGHKFVYFLLTSQELGYNKVQIERPINSVRGGKLCSLDLYVEEIGLTVEVNGPRHMLNFSKKERPMLASMI